MEFHPIGRFFIPPPQRITLHTVMRGPLGVIAGITGHLSEFRNIQAVHGNGLTEIDVQRHRIIRTIGSRPSRADLAISDIGGGEFAIGMRRTGDHGFTQRQIALHGFDVFLHGIGVLSTDVGALYDADLRCQTMEYIASKYVLLSHCLVIQAGIEQRGIIRGGEQFGRGSNGCFGIRLVYQTGQHGRVPCETLEFRLIGDAVDILRFAFAALSGCLVEHVVAEYRFGNILGAFTAVLWIMPTRRAVGVGVVEHIVDEIERVFERVIVERRFRIAGSGRTAIVDNHIVGKPCG